MATRYLAPPPGPIFPTPCYNSSWVYLGRRSCVLHAFPATHPSHIFTHPFHPTHPLTHFPSLPPSLRACGATICNRTDELKESDVGTKCGLFEVRKYGDEYFTFLVECTDPKACTIVLRGASKDILKEVTYTHTLPPSLQMVVISTGGT